tara:strand:- start:33 stop:1451 length:1419 start_codon:yes stop_codon:yes gene_type:complete
MAITIEQKPLYNNFPAGQQIIYTVSEPTVATYFNFKYIAEVYISTGVTINFASTSLRVAIFKTTPNNAGVGIFDLQPFLESYVTAQNTGVGGTNQSSSEYKTVDYSIDTPHPIHLIDKYSKNAMGIRGLAVRFKAEGSTTATGAVADLGFTTNGRMLYFFNGVLYQDNPLTYSSGNYGFNLGAADLYTIRTGDKFLTNAPTTQYANIDDYGTVGMLNFLPGGTSDRVNELNFEYFKKDGSSVTETSTQGYSAGGCTNLDNVKCMFLFAGIYPANLRNWSTVFQGLVTAGTIDYYTVQASSTASNNLSQKYTININCPNTKGYESVRLTWLNQWGAWDYYTFTQKSVKSLTTNSTTYTQMSGSWNDSKYLIHGYKGGRKNFRVNSTERIVVNTDYVTEEHSAWFEELINSTEVYILKGFDASETNPYNTITNKYVEPVLITTSDYTRKTVANDRLIQYTFNMERNKTRQTQTA